MQGLLNRQFSLTYGLATASFVNAIVFALFALLLFAVAKFFPHSFQEFIPPKGSYQLNFWHLIPGLCGFAIVVLTPWCIHYLGAAQVFILIVSSQILFSVLWDMGFNGINFSMMKFIGIGLVLVGAFLFSLK